MILTRIWENLAKISLGKGQVPEVRFAHLFLLIVFTFIMALIMVAINKTMDYFIYKNYLLHHNKKYYYN